MNCVKVRLWFQTHINSPTSKVKAIRLCEIYLRNEFKYLIPITWGLTASKFTKTTVMGPRLNQISEFELKAVYIVPSFVGVVLFNK